MTIPDNPLCLVAGRSVANAEAFTRGHCRPHMAIKNAGEILCVLITFAERDALWKATEQLCLGTMAMATGSRAGVDYLIAAVRAAQVEENAEREEA